MKPRSIHTLVKITPTLQEISAQRSLAKKSYRSSHNSKAGLLFYEEPRLVSLSARQTRFSEQAYPSLFAAAVAAQHYSELDLEKMDRVGILLLLGNLGELLSQKIDQNKFALDIIGGKFGNDPFILDKLLSSLNLIKVASSQQLANVLYILLKHFDNQQPANPYLELLLDFKDINQQKFIKALLQRMFSSNPHLFSGIIQNLHIFTSPHALTSMIEILNFDTNLTKKDLLSLYTVLCGAKLLANPYFTLQNPLLRHEFENSYLCILNSLHNPQITAQPELMQLISRCIANRIVQGQVESEIRSELLGLIEKNPAIAAHPQVLFKLLQALAKDGLGPLELNNIKQQRVFLQAIAAGKFPKNSRLLRVLACNLAIFEQAELQTEIAAALKYICSNIEPSYLEDIILNLFSHQYILSRQFKPEALAGCLWLIQRNNQAILCGAAQNQAANIEVELVRVCRALGFNIAQQGLLNNPELSIAQLQQQIDSSDQLANFGFAPLNCQRIFDYGISSRKIASLLADFISNFSGSAQELVRGYNLVANLSKVILGDLVSSAQAEAFSSLVKLVFNNSTALVKPNSSLQLSDCAWLAVLATPPARASLLQFKLILSGLAKRQELNLSQLVKNLLVRSRNLLSANPGALSAKLSQQLPLIDAYLNALLPAQQESVQLTQTKLVDKASLDSEYYQLTKSYPFNQQSQNTALILINGDAAQNQQAREKINTELRNYGLHDPFKKFTFICFCQNNQLPYQYALYQIQPQEHNQSQLTRLKFIQRPPTSQYLHNDESGILESKFQLSTLKPTQYLPTQYLSAEQKFFAQNYPQAVLKAVADPALPFDITFSPANQQQFNLAWRNRCYTLPIGQVFVFKDKLFQIAAKPSAGEVAVTTDYQLNRLSLNPKNKTTNLKVGLAADSYYYVLTTGIAETTNPIQTIQLKAEVSLQLLKDKNGLYIAADPQHLTYCKKWGSLRSVYHANDKQLFLLERDRLICVSHDRQLVSELFPSLYLKQGSSDNGYILQAINQLLFNPYTAAILLDSFKKVDFINAKYNFSLTIAKSHALDLFLNIKAYLTMHKINYIEVHLLEQTKQHQIVFSLASQYFKSNLPEHASGDLGFKLLEAVFALVISAKRQNQIAQIDHPWHKDNNQSTLIFAESGTPDEVFSLFANIVSDERNWSAEPLAFNSGQFIYEKLDPQLAIPQQQLAAVYKTEKSLSINTNPALFVKILKKELEYTGAEQINKSLENYLYSNNYHSFDFNLSQDVDLRQLGFTFLSHKQRYLMLVEYAATSSSSAARPDGLMLIDMQNSNEKCIFKFNNKEHLLILLIIIAYSLPAKHSLSHSDCLSLL